MINRKKIHDELVESIAGALYAFDNDRNAHTAEKVMERYLMDILFRNRVQFLTHAVMIVFDENVDELDRIADAIKFNPDFMVDITG